jgi:hypothetical protein
MPSQLKRYVCNALKLVREQKVILVIQHSKVSRARPIFKFTKWNLHQGCQMVCCKTKNPNLGKFWRAMEFKKLVYSMANWIILRPFGNLLAIRLVLVH